MIDYSLQWHNLKPVAGGEVSVGKPQHHQGHQPNGGDVSVHLDSPKEDKLIEMLLFTI